MRQLRTAFGITRVENVIVYVFLFVFMYGWSHISTQHMQCERHISENQYFHSDDYMRTANRQN